MLKTLEDPLKIKERVLKILIMRSNMSFLTMGF
jgi:hypothetical protein